MCPAVTGMTRATERISVWAWTADGLPGVFHCPLGVGVNAPVKRFALANVPRKERTGVYFQSNVIIRCNLRLVNIISCCALFTIAMRRYRYFEIEERARLKFLAHALKFAFIGVFWSILGIRGNWVCRNHRLYQPLSVYQYFIKWSNQNSFFGYIISIYVRKIYSIYIRKKWSYINSIKFS